MFIHVLVKGDKKTVDRQISVHAVETKPLSAAIDEAFKFYKGKQPAGCRVTWGKKVLSVTKTPKQNALEEGALVTVTAPSTRKGR